MRLYEVFETEQYIYMVMDFVTEDLNAVQNRRRLENRGFEEEECKHIVRGLLTALSILHDFGIVHRDVKLANMSISPEQPGGPMAVRLFDFGLAAIKTDDEDNEFPDGNWMYWFVGTPIYMAPEIAGRQLYNEKADVWSVGILAYVLMTGCQRPYGRCSSRAELMTKVSEGRVQMGHEAWTQYSAEAYSFVEMALKRDPEERMASFDAMQHPWLM